MLWARRGSWKGTARRMVSGFGGLGLRPLGLSVWVEGTSTRGGSEERSQSYRDLLSKLSAIHRDMCIEVSQNEGYLYRGLWKFYRDM